MLVPDSSSDIRSHRSDRPFLLHHPGQGSKPQPRAPAFVLLGPGHFERAGELAPFPRACLILEHSPIIIITLVVPRPRVWLLRLSPLILVVEPLSTGAGSETAILPLRYILEAFTTPKRPRTTALGKRRALDSYNNLRAGLLAPLGQWLPPSPLVLTLAIPDDP